MKIIYDTENILVEWRESRWLVLTTMGYLIPTLYSYHNHHYFLSYLTFTSFLISVNYWRKASFSFRRDLDIVFQKIAFLIYLYHGLSYLKGYRFMFSSYGLLYIFYNYYYSNKFYYEKKEKWLTYHMCFHIMVMLEQIVVLESVLKGIK
jgi:hypothetical protein